MHIMLEFEQNLEDEEIFLSFEPKKIFFELGKFALVSINVFF